MPPAARVTDLHTCPLSTPGIPAVPHVGGPILGPGVATVMIGGRRAAVVGDAALCIGASDAITEGSASVMIGGKPAARLGDGTAHGGQITGGLLTVIIGG